MYREFANKTASKSAGMFGLIFCFTGIGFMFINVLIGSIIVILALVIFLFMYFFGNDTTVICHETGFSVTIENNRKGKFVHDYSWEDVAETLYYEKESAGENNTTTCYFQVKTENGIAFNLYEMKHFHELIEIFNQNANHLPYFWEKPTGMFKTRYQKQNRVPIRS
jgi:flagellar basal body-associated protein FliL